MKLNVPLLVTEYGSKGESKLTIPAVVLLEAAPASRTILTSATAPDWNSIPPETVSVPPPPICPATNNTLVAVTVALTARQQLIWNNPEPVIALPAFRAKALLTLKSLVAAIAIVPVL